MNMFSTKVRTWFYSFMQVQLFLSLISLPILIAWGLPFSVMTVIGNLVFTPVLSLFLILSTCIFFLELLAIPNSWLIFMLEKLFDGWMYLLSFNSTTWLYGIDLYGCILSLFTALAACCILQHTFWGRAKNSWVPFCYLLAIPFAYQHIKSYFPQKTTITCLKKTAFIRSEKGKVFLFDKGALGEKQAASTWIQYTLLPEILKTCGSVHFATITCPYCNSRTLDALITLCKHAPVNKIALEHPYKKSREYKEKLTALKNVAHDQKITLLEQTMSAQSPASK